MTEREIVLVRHGQTEWSASGRHTGRTDVPLTELGRRQADALAQMLDRTEFSLVLSSPLARAWETMVRAGYEHSALADGDLMEWDYGAYEGRRTEEIQREIPNWSVWTHAVGDGESLDEVGARADRVIGRALEIDGKVALFAHGHLLRVLGARWMRLPPDVGRNLSLDTATVSTLGWERDTPVLRFWNESCHLRSVDPVL